MAPVQKPQGQQCVQYREVLQLHKTSDKWVEVSSPALGVCKCWLEVTLSWV